MHATTTSIIRKKGRARRLVHHHAASGIRQRTLTFENLVDRTGGRSELRKMGRRIFSQSELVSLGGTVEDRIMIHLIMTVS
jgi:hypothetical protein